MVRQLRHRDAPDVVVRTDVEGLIPFQLELVGQTLEAVQDRFGSVQVAEDESQDSLFKMVAKGLHVLPDYMLFVPQADDAGRVVGCNILRAVWIYGAVKADDVINQLNIVRAVDVEGGASLRVEYPTLHASDGRFCRDGNKTS